MSPITELENYIKSDQDLSQSISTGMKAGEVLEKLNARTGLDIKPNTPMSEGCSAFLEALKAGEVAKGKPVACKRKDLAKGYPDAEVI